MAVNTIINPAAKMVSFRLVKTDEKYQPNNMATIAVGAAKPMVVETHPVTKPAAG